MHINMTCSLSFNFVNADTINIDVLAKYDDSLGRVPVT